MKSWISIDPANKSGLAYWNGIELATVATLRPMGARGRYRRGDDLYDRKDIAWDNAITELDAVVIEEGFGSFVKAVAKQAELRGYIKAIADGLQIPVTVVNVSEWRRCIKEAYGVSWPRESARCKALSVSIVRQNYGIEVTDDEADAVLIGEAAVRMRLVDVTGVPL